MKRILSTGLLINKNHANYRWVSKYIITYLYEQHLPMVMNLQETIIQNLERPDLLQPFSYDFMKRHMGHQGFVLGVFAGHRLVAFRNLYYPDPWDEEWNLGRDMALPEEELSKVANLQMVCVHPDFRGSNLGYTMNQITLKLLRQRKTHHHICATVSPYNVWNLPILLSSGFQVVKLKNKYGGKLRYIVYQNLRTPVTYDDSRPVYVRLDDLDTQKKLLDSDYCGVAVRRREDTHTENRVSHFELVFKPRLCQKERSSNGTRPFLSHTFHPITTQIPAMAAAL